MGTPSNQLLAKWRFTLTLIAMLLAANVFAQTGPLNYIKIVEGASGNGPELVNKTLTADQSLVVHAAGYDAANNYLGDFSVTWSVSGGIGTLTPASGVTTTLDARTPGTGIIAADHLTATDDVSGLITVNAGAPHHVKILTGASGNATEVGAVTLTSGQTLTMHAGSFDADDNYVGDVTVTWSVTGGIGTLNPATGISTTFTATSAGTGAVNADHASLIDDATGVITVAAGALSYVKIIEGAAGNGPELVTKTLTTDQTLTVHAAGYDAAGNYLGDVSVDWSVAGGIGTLSSTSGTATTLAATKPGTGSIIADHATALDDATGIITVTVGAPHHVKILAGASGNTSEVGALTLLSGQTLALHASGFDADDNYIADVSVAWSVSGNIGTLTPANGVSTIFTATTLGTGVISADHPSLIDDATGTITVSAGALSYIKIAEGPSGNTAELGNKNLTADQFLAVHAAGYDAAGNYLGDFSVAWSVTGGIGVLSTTTGVTTMLAAQRPGAGVIMADHATATDDVSGTITVSVGVPHHIKILTGAIGATSEIGAVTLTTGQALVMHASSFDADTNYVTDVSVNWSVSNGIGTLSATTGISTVFTAASAGSGVITADHPALIDDTAGPITVVAGGLSYVKIVAGATGNGPELGAITLTTDQTLTVHAAGYDASGNYLGDQSVVWSLAGGTGVLSPTVGIATTFDPRQAGACMISADHPTAVDDETGTITVTLGVAHHLKILTGTSGGTLEVAVIRLKILDSLVVHAGSFDADDNYISDLSVDWSVSGNIGTLNPVTGAKTVFTARAAGSGAITASHVALIEDKTGVITVVDSTVKVESSPIGDGLPQNFQLWQNYPNPFHAGITATQIRYELPSRSLLKIAVYNLSGQLLRVLFDGQQNAGRYAVAWDGKILTGEPAPSGVYLVRLEAGQFVMARKIIVMR